MFFKYKVSHFYLMVCILAPECHMSSERKPVNFERTSFTFVCGIRWHLKYINGEMWGRKTERYLKFPEDYCRSFHGGWGVGGSNGKMITGLKTFKKNHIVSCLHISFGIC